MPITLSLSLSPSLLPAPSYSYIGWTGASDLIFKTAEPKYFHSHLLEELPDLQSCSIQLQFSVAGRGTSAGPAVWGHGDRAGCSCWYLNTYLQLNAGHTGEQKGT